MTCCNGWLRIPSIAWPNCCRLKRVVRDGYAGVGGFPPGKLAGPLSHLEPLIDDEATKEADAGWHYRVSHLYEF